MRRYFDCNVILGRIKTPMPQGILDAPRLLSEMDRYGVHESLVYHAMAKRNAPVRGNALAVEAARASERLHPCWLLLPPATNETPPLDALAGEMRAANVRAVRLAPDAGAHMYSLSEVVCGGLLRWLAEARVPVFVEFAAVTWHDVDRVIEIAPGLRLVLTDVTYRVDRDLYPRFKAYPSLHVETSGIEQHCGLQDMVERFGPDRILFGSRLPLMCPGAAIQAVDRAGISEDAKDRIAGENLRRLFSEVNL